MNTAEEWQQLALDAAGAAWIRTDAFWAFQERLSEMDSESRERAIMRKDLMLLDIATAVMEAARAEALEEAAEIVEQIHDNSDNDEFASGWRAASKDCSSSIRALKEKGE